MLCAASNMTCGGHYMVGFTVEKGLIRVAMPPPFSVNDLSYSDCWEEFFVK